MTFYQFKTYFLYFKILSSHEKLSLKGKIILIPRNQFVSYTKKLYCSLQSLLNYFHLNFYQSGEYINQSDQLEGRIIIKMQRNVQIFAALTARVPSTGVFKEIIEKQQNIYDIQPYKIENTQGQTMLKVYLSINNSRKCSNNRIFESNNWNENQRRVFVWFIICYTYFLQQDKKQFKESIYDDLSYVFFGKKAEFLHFQHLNLMKNKHRVAWTTQEDELLVKCTNQLNPGKWNQISKKIFYDSNRFFFRTPKHCRQRWLNHLDKTKKHGEWALREDITIFEYVLSNGKRWSKIVPLLNETRTEHMIKNRYNSLISKTRGTKKTKEQDVANKILNTLSATTEFQVVTQDKKEQKNTCKIERQNTDILPQINTRNLQHLSNSAKIIHSSSVQPFSSPIQLGCYLDYNYFYYPQLFFNENRFGVFQMQDRKNHLIQFSKNSSFSVYHSQI